MALSAEAFRALRWMNDFPSNKAEWTVDGRSLRAREAFSRVNAMKIEGTLGSIVVPQAAWRELHGLIGGCLVPDKIYSPTEAGLEALAAHRGPDRPVDGG